MNRRNFLEISGAGIFAIAAGVFCRIATGTEKNPAKPNVIFILIDDLGYMDIGANNPKTLYETPNIDRLAAQGMRFTDGYAACPVCSPTRASIMTGKYPARLHLTDWIPGNRQTGTKLKMPDWIKYLPLEETTIAEALKKAGYVTALIGKWHLGGERYLPEAQGFDVNVAGDNHGQPPSYFTPYKLRIQDGPDGEYLTDRLGDEALRFLEKNKNNPFFLYFPNYAVHTPLQAKKDIKDKYLAKGLPAKGENSAVYAAMIQSVDENVGRIMKKLDDLGIADNTIVFFMSDNGGLQGVTSNAPLRAGKGTLYEGGIREPWIVRWPGVVKPGSICSVPVISTDFYPTILAMTGVTEESAKAPDGTSIVPLLKGTGGVQREELYWHYPHYHRTTPCGAIRCGDLKLIEYFEDGKLELYDLRNDLSEKTDLALKMPEKAAELRRKLEDWRKAVGAQMPTLNSSSKLTIANFHDSLVPAGFVLSEADWHIWCNAPILDEQGKVHLFVSRWPVKDTFGTGWHTSCEIAHYRADKPEGPYTYVSTVLKGTGVDGSWRKDGTHNVSVVRLPDHRYTMLFIANSDGARGFPANQRIGMMLADSLDGPWKLAGQDGLILDVPADPGIWSHGSVVGVNNPSLLSMPDGRFLLYYKAMKPGNGEVRRMGVAIADKVEGPYRFAKEALTSNEGTIEDGFAFLLNGEVCLLVTDCHGEGYGGGMIYHSQNGIHFDPKSIRAYEAVDHYMKRWPNPANGWSPWVLQRPALLLGKDGTPTHLFAPCGTPPEGRQGTSTFMFEIKPGRTEIISAGSIQEQ